MYSNIQKIKQFYAQLKLEQIYNAFILFIISIILVMSTVALYRPIDSVKFQQVKVIANQPIYPESQEMAEVLLQQHTIMVGQYLRLMHAHQIEMNKATELPALSIED
ncbi:hypothetical protein [Acinetobacter faecalis]|uniref:hypothetical protein n=1 Tax=Acinetobacter faecalis TaxID=2665161 RepID=UPI002A90E0F7|nr:hypothetical protein [Acinetobacter faecalis]MDY6482533.1 hypothetical protein [Acinetobacter faecalis]MDY6485067.1 hypothetical protein [Acinetobacter faecalis]